MVFYPYLVAWFITGYWVHVVLPEFMFWLLNQHFESWVHCCLQDSHFFFLSTHLILESTLFWIRLWLLKCTFFFLMNPLLVAECIFGCWVHTWFLNPHCNCGIRICLPISQFVLLNSYLVAESRRSVQRCLRPLVIFTSEKQTALAAAILCQYVGKKNEIFEHINLIIMHFHLVGYLLLLFSLIHRKQQ